MTENVILKEFEKLRKRIMESKLVEDATAVEIGALFEISNIINRQKAGIERLQSMNQAKLDTIHDLMAENERLKTTYETLKQEYDSMFSANRNLMAEVEELTADCEKYKVERDEFANHIGRIREIAQAEAIKEFVEKLEEECYILPYDNQDRIVVFKDYIDNLAKELTERKDEKQ